MRVINVDEKYQTGYSYSLSSPVSRSFDPEFKPDLTPAEMLKLGIFSGDYFNEKPNEFPSAWFRGAKLAEAGKPDHQINFFKVKASQPLSVWKQKGWIYFEDPKGWFLWYCRYYLGRRIPDEDRRQIKRWKAMQRHVHQITKNCKPGDMSCHPKQRQALLHWAYDSRKI